jgi:hypothetical protein
MTTQRFIRLPIPTAQFGQEIRYRELRWLYASTRFALDERDQEAVTASATESIRRRLPIRMDVLSPSQAARLLPMSSAMLIP